MLYCVGEEYLFTYKKVNKNEKKLKNSLIFCFDFTVIV